MRIASERVAPRGENLCPKKIHEVEKVNFPKQNTIKTLSKKKLNITLLNDVSHRISLDSQGIDPWTLCV